MSLSFVWDLTMCAVRVPLSPVYAHSATGEAGVLGKLQMGLSFSKGLRDMFQQDLGLCCGKVP